MIYVANSGGNTISVINGTTNSVGSTIPVGDNPIGVGVNPNSNKIYVANLNSNYVSVINGTTNSVASTIPVGKFPTGVGVNPSTNKIYVSNTGDDTVSVIDGGTTVPSAPQNLQATAGNSQVSLSWTTPSSNGGSTITGYNIYRGTTSGGESITPTGTVSGSTLSYTDTGLTNGQAYFYKVTAVNSVGESVPSNEANATPTAPVTVTQPPTGLTTTTISSSQINLSWTAPNDNGGSAITG